MDAGEVAGERPLVVLPPDPDGAPVLRGQGDHAGEQGGVGDEVDDRGAERRQDLGHEGAVRGAQRQVDEAGEVRGEDVVADVEDDLDAGRGSPRRR